MALTELSLGEGFYESASRPFSFQRCQNVIPIYAQSEAVSKVYLGMKPGITAFADTMDGPSRKMHEMNGISYSVNGNSLYRINSNGTADNLGPIEGVGRVAMDDNGIQICIVVPGITAYIFEDDTDTLTEITDANFLALGPSLDVVYKDTFFIHHNGKEFYNSDVNNGLIYPGDFGTAEVDPDGIVGMHVSRNLLFIFGSKTLEIFQTTGGTGFPFQRINSPIMKGLRAKFSPIDFNGTFVFIGAGLNEKPAVYQYTGNDAIRISTDAIDIALSEYTQQQIFDSFSTVHSDRGGYFVAFHLPRNTFVYDATATRLAGKHIWHERFSGASEPQNPWRVADIVEAYGLLLVSDRFDGRIGVLDRKIAKEYDDPILCKFTLPPIPTQGLRARMPFIELTLESGTSDLLPPFDDAKVGLAISDDGSRVFGQISDRTIGVRGDFTHRTVWRNKGSFTQSRVLEFTYTAPVVTTFTKCVVDLI